MQKSWINKGLLLFIFFQCILVGQNFAQSNQDLTYIDNAQFEDERFEGREVNFLLSNRPDVSPIIKYNPITLTLGGLMYGYQTLISPQISSKCSFRPTCSQFSVEAIQEFGFIKGLALSADRLCRCSPIAARDISRVNIDKSQRVVVNKPVKYHLKPVD